MLLERKLVVFNYDTVKNKSVFHKYSMPKVVPTTDTNPSPCPISASGTDDLSSETLGGKESDVDTEEASEAEVGDNSSYGSEEESDPDVDGDEVEEEAEESEASHHTPYKRPKSCFSDVDSESEPEHTGARHSPLHSSGLAQAKVNQPVLTPVEQLLDAKRILKELVLNPKRYLLLVTLDGTLRCVDVEDSTCLWSAPTLTEKGPAQLYKNDYRNYGRPKKHSGAWRAQVAGEHDSSPDDRYLSNTAEAMHSLTGAPKSKPLTSYHFRRAAYTPSSSSSNDSDCDSYDADRSSAPKNIISNTQLKKAPSRASAHNVPHQNNLRSQRVVGHATGDLILVPSFGQLGRNVFVDQGRSLAWVKSSLLDQPSAKDTPFQITTTVRGTPGDKNNSSPSSGSSTLTIKVSLSNTSEDTYRLLGMGTGSAVATNLSEDQILTARDTRKTILHRAQKALSKLRRQWLREDRKYGLCPMETDGPTIQMPATNQPGVSFAEEEGCGPSPLSNEQIILMNACREKAAKDAVLDALFRVSVLRTNQTNQGFVSDSTKSWELSIGNVQVTSAVRDPQQSLMNTPTSTGEQFPFQRYAEGTADYTREATSPTSNTSIAVGASALPSPPTIFVCGEIHSTSSQWVSDLNCEIAKAFVADLKMVLHPNFARSQSGNMLTNSDIEELRSTVIEEVEDDGEPLSTVEANDTDYFEHLVPSMTCGPIPVIARPPPSTFENDLNAKALAAIMAPHPSYHKRWVYYNSHKQFLFIGDPCDSHTEVARLGWSGGGSQATHQFMDSASTSMVLRKPTPSPLINVFNMQRNVSTNLVTEMYPIDTQSLVEERWSCVLVRTSTHVPMSTNTPSLPEPSPASIRIVGDRAPLLRPPMPTPFSLTDNHRSQLLQKYTLKGLLGKGSEGVVVLAQCEFGFMHAIKIVSFSPSSLNQSEDHDHPVLKEVKTHFPLNDRNLVRLYEFWVEKESPELVAALGGLMNLQPPSLSRSGDTGVYTMSDTSTEVSVGAIQVIRARAPTMLLMMKMEYCPRALDSWLYLRASAISELELAVEATDGEVVASEEPPLSVSVPGTPTVPPELPLRMLLSYRTSQLRLQNLHIAMQLFSALMYVHSSGLVHLDVKPLNLFIMVDERAVLSRFHGTKNGAGSLQKDQFASPTERPTIHRRMFPKAPVTVGLSSRQPSQAETTEQPPGEPLNAKTGALIVTPPTRLFTLVESKKVLPIYADPLLSSHLDDEKGGWILNNSVSIASVFASPTVRQQSSFASVTGTQTSSAMSLEEGAGEGIDEPCSRGLRKAPSTNSVSTLVTSGCYAAPVPDPLFMHRRLLVKLGDFGISAPSAVLGIPAVDAVPTAFGTRLYASPEQKAGKHCTAASDVFSAGLVMLEMFASEPTASGRLRLLESASQRGYAGIPQGLRDAYPDEMERIGRCIQNAPEDRPTANEMFEWLCCLTREVA